MSVNDAVSPLFIGPAGERSADFNALWNHLFSCSVERRRQRFPHDPAWESASTTPHLELQSGMDSLLRMLHEEIPTFSPRYLGHMVSDVSVPALLGHMAMLFENANLASREAAVVASAIETEAINQLASMVSLDPGPTRGHFTSGGTMANFEAVWRARYRLDHWLSLALWKKLHVSGEQSLFDLAHCGWDRFEHDIQKHGLIEEELAPYSAVLRGPLELARLYREQCREEWPEPVILVPGNKHYSWPKAANVFGLGVGSIRACELDDRGRLSATAVRKRILEARDQGRPVMMVVSVAGTTELGMIDPVDEVASELERLRQEDGLHIWHHVDAAYGGYFCSTLDSAEQVLSQRSCDALAALPRANSITLDPHKLGFVPYACGAFLVPDAASYSVSRIHAPYLEQHREVRFPDWATTLEGSRAATGAGAVWLSSQALPLNASGHGRILSGSLQATRQFYQLLSEASERLQLLEPSDTNVICFTVAAPGDALSVANRNTESVLAYFKNSPELGVTRTALGRDNYGELIQNQVRKWDGKVDAEQMTVVRMVVMNPYLDDAHVRESVGKRLLACIDEAIGAVL